MKSFKKKAANLALALMLACGLLPTTALAVEQDSSKDQVRVIIENTTLTPDTAGGLGATWDDSYWYGTLVDTYVDLNEESTMMSCIDEALKEVDANVVGVDMGYISSINGLGEFSGGMSGSGWMGVLNDWFVNMGFPMFTVADGTLVAGDTIRVMHTTDMGVDLGGDFMTSSNTTLTALSVDGGAMDKEFASDTLGYTVTVPADAAEVTVKATAFNKQNNVVLKIGDTEYRRTAAVPVEDGTEIKVICGEGVGATTYELTIVKEKAIEPTVIYTGSDWPYSRYHVASLTLDGAVVDYVTGSGSDYHVYLNDETANDAALSLAAAAGGAQSGNLGISFNDGDNSKTYDFALNNGEAAVKVYAYKAQGAGVSRSGTKTFSFHIAEPNNAPALASGMASSVEVEVVADKTYELDLTEVFADADGDALTYTVSIDGNAAVSTDAKYAMSVSMASSHELVFIATDGKTAAQNQPTYKVKLDFVNSENTYDVTVSAPEGASPTFYASDASGTLGAELVASPSDGGYKVKVPENVSFIAWRADDMGMSAAVEKDGELSLVKTDFVVKAGGEVDTGASIVVKYGDLTAAGSGGSYLLLEGAKYSYLVTPSDSAYRSASLANQDSVSGEKLIELDIKHFTVTAPEGSTVSAGTRGGYFKFAFVEPLSTKLEGGKVVYEFAPLGTNSFIRVQNSDPDAVTYWETRVRSTWADGLSYEVTKEMLCLDDEGTFDSSTIDRSFKNTYDLADIYLNINEKGYINLEVGGTKEINAFRNWHAYVDTISNVGEAIPDMSYKVIDENGNASDVVSVIAHKDNSAVADLTANKPGTAIVLVTYDAMTNKDAAGGSQFSAIWPERTGVFVVSVGADGSSIETNMTLNGGAIDAEHAPLFYVGDAGATYSFKPEDGCSVSIARATLMSDSLTYSGFTSSGIVKAEDGTVTISGLTSGRHIVKVEKDGVASYQVITAHKVSYVITDAEGSPINAENPADPGEVVSIQFTGLTSPAEKLSGIYNNNFAPAYIGEDGTSFTRSGGGYGVYNFSSTASLQKLGVTIPAAWGESTYDLTSGYIKVGGFSPKGIGSHRGVTYAAGASVNTSSPAASGALGSLPAISIPVAVEEPEPEPEPATYEVTLPTGEGYVVEPAEGSSSPVAEGGSYTFAVSIGLFHEKGADFAVKANGAPLIADEDGYYTIENIAADQTVTVEGVVERGGAPEPEVLLGDVSGDGLVDSEDAMLVLQYSVGSIVADDDFDEAAGDVSGDGLVDSEDAMLVLQYSVGSITKFPAVGQDDC